MPSRAEVEQIRSANAELTRLLNAELTDFLASISEASPENVRDALLDVIPALTAEYGDAAATVAAEWFEDVYGGRVVLAPTYPTEAVEQGVRYVAGKLWTPQPGEIAGLLATHVDKWVKQPGRETLTASAARNNLTWARVPTGAKTCAFCLVLASRDAVYMTEKAATRRSDGNLYHGKCDCVPVPMSGPDDAPEGYDPDGLYGLYTSARNGAGSDDIKDIAAEMRRQNPDLVTDAVHEH
jgi:hypothetical protein